MRRTLLAALLALLSLPAAAADVHRLAWDVSVAGQKVGSREATVTVDRGQTGTTRVIEAMTSISVSLAGQSLAYQQRLTAIAERAPASFHAVIKEDGRPREVQGRWSGTGWTVTRVDGSRVRTEDAPASRIDLSTADLFDPGSRYHLGRFDTVKVLSAETGDVWEGRVEKLGPSTVQVAGASVDVVGYAWHAPDGTSRFWYTSDGWLVKYETRIVGVKVEGVMTTPPPKGPDAFAVGIGRAEVEVSEL